MKLSILIAASTAALLAPAMAMAQPQQAHGMLQHDGPAMGMSGPDDHRGPPSPERMFAEMDANHDGVVSKAEFMAFRARHGAHRLGPPPGPPPRPR